MKNRRMLIAVFMCFAMLFVGIGYAQLVGHLEISGNASYDKEAAEDGFVENLVFSNAQVTQSGSAETETVKDAATGVDQQATFTVKTLAVQDEKAIFTYSLTNNNTVDVEITVAAQHDDGTANPTHTFSYYQIDSIVVDTETMVTDNERVADATYTLGEGETVTVTVTVSLKQTPTTTVVPETYFVHLTATSVDAAVNAG